MFCKQQSTFAYFPFFRIHLSQSSLTKNTMAISILLKSNAVEIIGVLCFVSWACLVCLLGVLLRIVSGVVVYGNYYSTKNYIKAECGWLYFFAWVGTAIVWSIYASLLWVEVYETVHEVDAAPYVFACLWCYSISMFGWLYGTYLIRKFVFVGHVCSVLCLCFALINTLLVFIGFHNPSHWYHYFGLLLLLLPLFTIQATRCAQKNFEKYTKERAQGTLHVEKYISHFDGFSLGIPQEQEHTYSSVHYNHLPVQPGHYENSEGVFHMDVFR